MSKFLKQFKSNNLSIRVLLFLVVAFIALFATRRFDVLIIDADIGDMFVRENYERRFTQHELYTALTDFSINGNVITSTSDDPWIFLDTAEVNVFKYIRFDIDLLNRQNVVGQLFYLPVDAGYFSEGRSVVRILSSGINYIRLPQVNIEALRLDLTNEEGVSLIVNWAELTNRRIPALPNLLLLIFLNVLWCGIWFLLLFKHKPSLIKKHKDIFQRILSEHSILIRILLFLVVVFIAFTATRRFDVNIIGADIGDMFVRENYERRFTQQELYANLKNFYLDGNIITSTSDDPWILLDVAGINVFKYIRLDIDLLSREKMPAQFYYLPVGWEKLSEDKSVRQIIRNGINYIRLPQTELRILRLDLTEREGVSLVVNWVELTNRRIPALPSLLLLIFLNVLWCGFWFLFLFKRKIFTKLINKFTQIRHSNNKRVISLAIISLALLSLLLSVVLVRVILHDVGYTLMTIYRIGFIFCFIFFLLLHTIIKITVFYDKLFRYRYVVAIFIFLILVTNKIHFSSIGMWDHIIQPGLGTEFIEPIFGTPRYIRSDEWLVTTPARLSSQFGVEPYGRYNYILRGTQTENLPMGVRLNLTTLIFPLNFFYIFGPEYGISAMWVGLLIITFMLLFEFMHIISKRKRLIALTGASLVTFSPFFLWRSFVPIITNGIGILVCFHYFINSENRIKKIFLALGMTIFFSQFIVTFYPAWQVPFGYLYLGLGIWFIYENWEKIKTIRKIDWLIFGAALLFSALLIILYILEIQDYMAGIMNTIYPGARQISGGNINVINMINRMLNGGLYSPISGYRTFLNTNVSEFSGFYSLFPIPIIYILFIIIKKRIYDPLSIFLVSFSLIMSSYVFIGWPSLFARITLMSYSFPQRAMDVVMFIQVLLLICSLSRFSNEKEILLKKEKAIHDYLFLPVILSIMCSFISTFISYSFAVITFHESIGMDYFVVMFIGISMVTYSIFINNHKAAITKIACIYLVCYSIIICLTVLPIMRGLDVIYSKPVASKIKELAVDHNEKWLSLHSGFIGSGFLVATGASAINAINFYPNLDLWHKLDPDRKYEEIYNRYAHITVSLTENETSFSLLHADQFFLNLSYRDLKKTGVRFIFTSHHLTNFSNIEFILLYNEAGTKIYYVNFLDELVNIE